MVRISIKRMIRMMRRRIAAQRSGILKALGKSDRWRWSNDTELLREWDERTELIASHIDAFSSVIEFGAGRQMLKGFLRDGCVYVPSDLVDRGGAFICDLNGDLPELTELYDYAVFAGVFEYVFDIERTVVWIASNARVIIASYAPIDTVPEIPRRHATGWVNHYSVAAFQELFHRNGYSGGLIHRWRDQRVFRFERGR